MGTWYVIGYTNSCRLPPEMFFIVASFTVCCMQFSLHTFASMAALKERSIRHDPFHACNHFCSQGRVYLTFICRSQTLQSIDVSRALQRRKSTSNLKAFEPVYLKLIPFGLTHSQICLCYEFGGEPDPAYRDGHSRHFVKD